MTLAKVREPDPAEPAIRLRYLGRFKVSERLGLDGSMPSPAARTRLAVRAVA
jgi:hypothetical protein